MGSLANQISELEDDLGYEKSRADNYAETIDTLESQLSEAEEELKHLRAFTEWVNNTYPDAELAYAGKQRLDNASVGSA